MRLQISATPQELRAKRSQLIKALIDQVTAIDPELAEQLEKALPRKEPELKYKVLQQLKQKTTSRYQKTLIDMVSDIEDVLEGTTPDAAKSEHPYLEKAVVDFFTKGDVFLDNSSFVRSHNLDLRKKVFVVLVFKLFV